MTPLPVPDGGCVQTNINAQFTQKIKTIIQQNDPNHLGSFISLQIENHFDGNICRCTGYRPILESFKNTFG